MLNLSAFPKGADLPPGHTADTKPQPGAHSPGDGRLQASSSRDNLATKPGGSASSRPSSDQPKHSLSDSALLPPYPAGQRPHLPTPQSSAHSPPRHLDVRSPGSPSIPLSSRAHGTQQEAQRRSVLSSQSAAPTSHPGHKFAQRMSHLTPSPSPGTLPSSSPVQRRATHSSSDIFDVATPTSSPARGHLRDTNLQTPSSPDRQESLPRTPAQPHSAWDIAHVSSSPLDGIPKREVHIERSVQGKRDPFIGQEPKSLQASASVPLHPQLDELHGFLPGASSPDRVPSSSRSHLTDTYHSLPINRHNPHTLAQPRLAPPLLDPNVADAPQTPRMQHAEGAYRNDAQRAHLDAREQKRPEYLKRSKRPRDPSDTAAAERHEREQSLPGLGVHVSPKKGRRLKLYQPPTPKQGPSSSKVPSTPRLQPGSVISSKARAWLDASSPSTSRTRTKSLSNEEKAEKENRKRKRLSAFVRKAEPQGSPPLEVYDVEGRGRMLVSKIAARTQLIVSNEVPPPSKPVDPDWPDSEHPWVSSVKRPPGTADMSEEERRARLHWIERFLDRDSDEDSSDESAKFQSSPSRTGKGSSSSGDTRARLASLAEPLTDARIALFSRREAKRLNDAHEAEGEQGSQDGSEGTPEDDDEEDDGIVSCICGEDEDERPMVACDRCSIWFHQTCMGIKNPNDLADTWYCFDCRNVRTPTPPPPPPQPVFSVSSPDTHIRPALDRPLFQSSGLTASPAFDSRLYAGLGSPSPARSHDPRPPSSSSSWLDTPDLPRHAPSTPFGSLSSRDSRILRTPGGFDPFNDDAPFDPTSTPSRGLGFGNISFATPTQPVRRSSGGYSGTPVFPVTPKLGGSRAGPSFFSSMDDPFVSSSPLDRLAHIVGEESPLAARTKPQQRATTPTAE